MASEFLDDKALSALGREVDENYVSPFQRKIGSVVKVLDNVEMSALLYHLFPQRFPDASETKEALSDEDRNGQETPET